MKKHLLFILFLLLSSMNISKAQNIPTKGDGSDGSPFQIENLSHLRWLSESSDLSRLSKSYILTANIDATDTKNWNAGKGFSPIGSWFNSFEGSFDGDYHHISKLYINRPTEVYIGLFGYVDNSSSQIKNLGLIEVDIRGKNTIGAIVGGLRIGTVSQCFATGNISGVERVGGLVGHSGSSSNKIENSFSNVHLDGDKSVGGILGYSYNGTIRNCYALGKVENGTSNVGGLLGYVESDAEIYNCYWDRETTGRLFSAEGGTILSTADFSDLSKFSGWSSNVWEIATKVVTGNVPRPILKKFSNKLHDAKLTLSSNLPSDVSSDKVYYKYGEQVVLSVSQNPGYRFVKWMANGVGVSTKSSYTFTLTESSSLEYMAYFVEDLSFAGGNGSVENPYQIATLEHLAQLAYVPSLLDKHYILINDIDATNTRNWNDGKGFKPIGTYDSDDSDKAFRGSFNGDGHTVSNLYINRPSEDGVGLFGNVNNPNPKINDLGLVNTEIIGRDFVGSIAGVLYPGKILNCFATGNISGVENVGGLVGNSSSTSIENSFSNVHLDGDKYVGGILGFSNAVTIRNCYAMGKIEHGTSYVGGLLGYGDSYTDIYNCYWDRRTTGQIYSYRGGRGLSTADFSDASTFTDWSFDRYWEISTNPMTGNVARPYLKSFLYDDVIEVKYLPEGLYTSDFIDGNYGESLSLGKTLKPEHAIEKWMHGNTELSAQYPYFFTLHQNSPRIYTAHIKEDSSFAGGNGSVENPYQIATLKHLGKLSYFSSLLDKHYILINDIDATDTRNWNDGQGFSPIGNDSVKFTGSFDGNFHVISNLYINRPTEDYIGLFGRVSHSSSQIKNLGLLAVDIRGDDYLGAIVGGLRIGTVSQCFATGKISGHWHVGGLVGYSSSSSNKIENSFSNVHLDGDENVGGILGHSFAVTIRNSYAMGKIEDGRSNVGGLLGYGDSYAHVFNSYWDTETTGQASSDEGGTALSTADFSVASTFTDWNFDRYWEISTNPMTGNVARPYLKALLYDDVIEVKYLPEGLYASDYKAVNYGDALRLGKTLKSGHVIDQWKEGTNVLSTDYPYVLNFSAQSPKVFTAHIIQDLSFAGGDGTVENPYQIATLEHLAKLSHFSELWDKHFILTAAIDATETKTWNDGKGFLPIGNSTTAFTGSLDGNKKSISNLYIKREKQNYVGLFSELGTGAEIKNLSLLGFDFIGKDYVGGLVAKLGNSRISNVMLNGKIKAEDYVGGIVGYSSSTGSSIEKSISNVSIEALDDVGGVLGRSDYVSIDKVYALGKIVGTSDLGGILGYGDSDASIQNSYWDTESTKVSESAEGGTALSTTEFADIFNLSDLGDFWEIATFLEIDANPRPYLKENIYDALVELKTRRSDIDERYIAGVNYGENLRLDIADRAGYKFEKWFSEGAELSREKNHSFAFSQSSTLVYTAHYVEDFSFAGGNGTALNPYEIATLEHLETLSNLSSLWDKNYILMVSLDARKSEKWNKGKGFIPIGNKKNQFTGFFRGNAQTIKNLYINRPDEDFVGLFGYTLLSSRIEKLGLLDVNIKGQDKVGSLVGLSYGEVSKCFATGELTANEKVGGLVGENYKKIEQVYTNVLVTGQNQVGGLVGNIGYNDFIIESYAFGEVKGAINAGGLAGSSLPSAKVERSYWDVETTKQGSSSGSVGGAGVNTVDFVDISDFNGWDLNVWEVKRLSHIDDNLRPYLKWQIYGLQGDIFDISTSSNLGGTITASTTEADRGDDVVFTFTAHAGYHLKSFTINGSAIVVSDGAYTHKGVQEDINAVAEFERNIEDDKYAVTISSNTGGQVMASLSKVAKGGAVSFTITSESTHKLASFIVNGAFVTPTNGFYTVFNVQSEVQVIAVFSVNTSTIKHNVSVSSSPGGTLTSSVTEIKEGSDLNLSVLADDGYRLLKLLVNNQEVSVINDTYTIRNVQADVVALAVFEQIPVGEQKYTISLGFSNFGSVLASATEVKAGEPVVFIVSAKPDYRFVSLTINGATVTPINGVYTFANVQSDLTAVAEFELIPVVGTKHTISLHSNTGGTLTADKVEVETGSSVRFTVSENPDYRFVSLTINGSTVTPINGVYTFANVQENLSAVANFELIPVVGTKHTISLHSNTGGALTADKVEVETGSSVRFTVSEATDYRFVSLTINGATVTPINGVYTFTNVQSDLTAVANFELIPVVIVKYAINTSSNLGGSLTTDKTEVEKGESVNFTLTSNDGYRLKELKVNDVVVTPTNGIYVSENVQSDLTAVAEFELIPVVGTKHTISLHSNTGGTLTADKVEVETGSSVSFTVSENPDYRFVSLTINGATVTPINGVYTFANVQSDLTAVANFELIPVVIVKYAINTSSNLGGSLTTDKTEVEKGESVNFTLTSNDGYRLKELKVNDVVVTPTNGIYVSENVQSDLTAVASFELIPVVGTKHTISLHSNTGGALTADKAEVETGSSVRFTVSEATDYRFVSLTINGATVTPINGVYTFTNVQSDLTAVANFELIPVVKYSVSTSTGIGGSLSTSKAEVKKGEDLNLIVTPDVNYKIKDVLVNGKSIGAVSNHLLYNIQEDKRVEAIFEKTAETVYYKLTTSISLNGSISLAKDQIEAGESISFTVVPNAGYKIKDVLVNGKSIGPVSNHLLYNIQEDKRIEAIFEKTAETVYYKLTTSISLNGSISLAKDQIEAGESISFTVVPNAGYKIKDVLVNGKSIGAVSNHLLYNIQEDKRVEAIFEKTAETVYYKLTTSISLNGSISLAKDQIEAGESISFTVAPNAGYKIKDVLVNGKSIGAVSNHLLYNIQEDKRVEAIFEKISNEVLNNNPSEDKITIYPNPVLDYLNLRNVSKGSLIRLANLQGQVLQSKVSEGKLTTLDLSNLKEGVYLVLVEGEKAQKIVKK